ncbi:MAG: PIN domain-containing protein [Chloroflexi bacterium]|nr:PIN domain-containing protein [Chloroflexota bacterium]
MTIIADTSYLFALYNSKDINHQVAATFAFETASERMLLPDVALTELAYLLVRDLGYVALRTLVENLRDSEIELVPLVRSDLGRISDIATTYASATFDIVDCCLMAIAERLGLTRIATFDRRDFSIFRPRHCDYLDLLPTL